MIFRCLKTGNGAIHRNASDCEIKTRQIITFNNDNTFRCRFEIHGIMFWQRKRAWPIKRKLLSPPKLPTLMNFASFLTLAKVNYFNAGSD